MKRNVTKLTLAIFLLSTLTACGGVTPAETSAAQTLADLAAANSTTAADLIAKGQLFCQKAAPVVGAAPLVTAVVQAATGAPISVIGQTAADVSAICAAIGAVPVPPPTTTPTATTPVVKVPV